MAESAGVCGVRDRDGIEQVTRFLIGAKQRFDSLAQVGVARARGFEKRSSLSSRR